MMTEKKLLEYENNMKLIINAASDKGLVRQRNEDMILVGSSLVRDSQFSTVQNIDDENTIFLFAVADGMGGHNAGDCASEYVVNSIAKIISNMPINLSEDDLTNFLELSFSDIHNELNNKGKLEKERAGMGSTFNGLLFYNQKILNINIGDSRFFRFRDGILKQMSKDHSLAEVTGLNRNESHILLNSVGGGESIFVEIKNVTDLILENDILLLCSDGLSDMISNDEIENVLTKSATTSALIDASKANGGHDNISVVLCMVR